MGLHPSLFNPPSSNVRISGGRLVRNGHILAVTEDGDPAKLYRALGCNYPKFFKMDALCKWAWLGAEALLKNEDGTWCYEDLDKRRIAVVLATRDGCLEVDYRYQESTFNIASPALFVYTLPNIMLGEICIRHGFKGEQLCEVQDVFNADELLFWVRDLIQHRDTTHCLFGWVDAVGNQHDINLFWMDASTLQAST